MIRDGTTTDTDAGRFAEAAPPSDLREAGRRLVNRRGHAIAVFHHDGAVHALARRTDAVELHRGEAIHGEEAEVEER